MSDLKRDRHKQTHIVKCDSVNKNIRFSLRLFKSIETPVAFHFCLNRGLRKTSVTVPPTVSRSSNKYYCSSLFIFLKHLLLKLVTNTDVSTVKHAYDFEQAAF